jgi:hypothetical protein
MNKCWSGGKSQLFWLDAIASRSGPKDEILVVGSTDWLPNFVLRNTRQAMTFISMTFSAPSNSRYTTGKEWMQNITSVRRLHRFDPDSKDFFFFFFFSLPLCSVENPKSQILWAGWIFFGAFRFAAFRNVGNQICFVSTTHI